MLGGESLEVQMLKHFPNVKTIEYERRVFSIPVTFIFPILIAFIQVKQNAKFLEES